MLDPTMTYSCAYWERPGMTLEEAQRAKNRHICEKLGLGPGDHVLEIGCGWGGFAIQARDRLRLSRHGADTVAEPGGVRTRRASRRGPRRPDRDPRGGLPAHRGALLEDRLDRDVRGDRPWPSTGTTSAQSTGSRSRRARLPADDRRAGLALRALPPPARLDPADDLPRLAAAVAGGDRARGRRARGCRSTASRRSASAMPARCASGART